MTAYVLDIVSIKLHMFMLWYPLNSTMYVCGYWDLQRTLFIVVQTAFIPFAFIMLSYIPVFYLFIWFVFILYFILSYAVSKFVGIICATRKSLTYLVTLNLCALLHVQIDANEYQTNKWIHCIMLIGIHLWYTCL